MRRERNGNRTNGYKTKQKLTIVCVPFVKFHFHFFSITLIAEPHVIGWILSSLDIVCDIHSSSRKATKIYKTDDARLLETKMKGS